MNIKEYISSGILEAYALGELPESERQQVAMYADEYPEIGEELDRIERVQEALLAVAAVEPRPELREQILNPLRDELPARDHRPASAASFPWRLMAAASLVLAVIAGGLAIYFYQNWQDARTRLSEMIAQNQQVAENYNQVQSDLERIQSDLNVLGNPDYARISLNRPEGGTEAQIYWNRESREVYLRTIDLANLAQNQQYQLWALIDGQPVDAGVFDASPGVLRKMNNIARADAFAVTIEPRGGSASPTLSRLQVIGETL